MTLSDKETEENLQFDEETEENLQCGRGGGPGAKSGGGGDALATKKASAAGAVIDQLQKPRSVGNREGDKAFAEIRARRIERATATNTINARRNASPKTFEAGLRQAVTGKSKSQVKREMKAEAKRRKTS